MERRAQIIKKIEAETCIDETMIEQLVRGFYLRVREDALLGPIFDARIAEWEPHLQRMCAFWSSVTLMSGRYHGQPMRLHLPLPIDARYFDRWLALFETTARDACPPKSADVFIDRAHRIAQSLEFGVAAARGIMLGKGDRLMSGIDGSPEAIGCDAAPVARSLTADRSSARFPESGPANAQTADPSPQPLTANVCRSSSPDERRVADDGRKYSAKRTA